MLVRVRGVCMCVGNVEIGPTCQTRSNEPRGLHSPKLCFSTLGWRVFVWFVSVVSSNLCVEVGCTIVSFVQRCRSVLRGA